MYKFSASAFMHAEVRAAPRRIHEFFKDLCWNLSSFSRTWKSFHRARTSKDDTEDYAHARKYVTGSTCTSPLRECFFGCASKLITIRIRFRFFLYFFFCTSTARGFRNVRWAEIVDPFTRLFGDAFNAAVTLLQSECYSRVLFLYIIYKYQLIFLNRKERYNVLFNSPILA